MSRVGKAIIVTSLLIVAGCGSAARSSPAGRGRYIKGYIDRQATQGPVQPMEGPRDDDHRRDLDDDRMHEEMLREQREAEQERQQQQQEQRERDLERAAGSDTSRCLSCP